MKLIWLLFARSFFICVSCMVRGILSLFGVIVELKKDLKRSYHGRREK